MKSQHRLGKLRPLTLKQGHAWCEEAALLMNEKGLFKAVFQIDESSIQFASHIASNEQADLCALVDREFSPRLMT
jgi:hypothetical protein